jgi:uncharacterized protein YdaU (DUF1376 family)
MHYYQHHIGDFIKATSRLTDSQAMAYLRLIWMYYDSEKPLPNDIEVLALQVGLSADQVHLLLRAYFRLEDGVWKHSRCDAELEEYRSFVGKKSLAGKASAEQRKNKRITPAEQVLNECSTDVQLTNNHKPITNNHKPITNNHKPIKTSKADVERPDDIPEDLWIDFQKHRKIKKAQITQRVIDTLRKEGDKAGLKLPQVMEKMIVNNWQGFHADWVKSKEPKQTDWWMNDRRIK